MDVKFSAASSAYADALKRVTSAGGSGGKEAAGVSGSAGAPSFADLLQDAAQEAKGTLQHSEAVGLQSLTKEAGLTEVVTAVSSAEVTLRTVVAVRDRLVQAYQEVMKMPI
jgi:flagellar hook-basal body complex protein FliE